jgi:2-deoxy-D-gluconate 3-dehydrogenase
MAHPIDPSKTAETDLTGTVAIVTGAGRGLGRAVAHGLAAAGARVTLFSRTADELEAAASEIRNAGGEALVMPGDIAGGSHVARMVSETVAAFGGVDTLVNNAGVIGPARFLEDADPESWSSTLAVNLTGPYHACREAIPHMIQRGGGSIINVTSGLARMPFPHFCAYGASKAGVNQLTRSLSDEYRAAGIRVNAVDPGVMDTPMQAEIREAGRETLRPEVHGQFLRFKENGALADPDDLVPLFRFLAAPAGRHVTGRILSAGDLDGLSS